MNILKILSYIFLEEMSQLNIQENIQENIQIDLQKLNRNNKYKKLFVVIPENYEIIGKPKPTIVSPISTYSLERPYKKQKNIFTFELKN